GKRIKVYAYSLQAGADSSAVQLTNGSGGSNLTINWSLNNREGLASATIKPPNYLFATTAGTS
ncbi:MAG TPA: hypothetical protein DCG68_05555, partial [Cryomorphaceae bacterium]|nr:hypothetical protein [Cryomorphaceae bacterium]